MVNVRATQALLTGDDDDALRRFQEATRLSAEVGTTWTLVYGLPGLATVAARRGQLYEAAVLFAAGATTSDASSVVVAFPPDLAFAQEAVTRVRTESSARRSSGPRGIEAGETADGRPARVGGPDQAAPRTALTYRR